ncbi:hypothetical protein [Dyadobacter sp. NIV53]|uniref:hypothetical protein n=1 Tax=Dyadobacter sp. NIV53 TaxID=2861765 RepID=UPI001C869C5F|nr:hypothetical protein [Dyadobacter sp. NIV53]
MEIVKVPVDTKQVGWVSGVIVGCTGVAGCALMDTELEAAETQPLALVTVYE